MPKSDLGFVQGCLKGDKQSWNEFLSRYSRLIYHYIYNVLKTRGYHYNQEDVSDIYQDIFRLLIKDDYKKLSSFKAKNGCSLASWLRQVTINSTLDYLRKVKNPPVSIDDDSDGSLALKDRLQDAAVSVPELLNNQEKLLTLKDCIGLLDTDEQYFLELFLNQGLKLEELRFHLKLNRGAVDMRKARIFKKLEDCFKSKGFGLDFGD
ncbi:MAG: sigma-70 family RNA polymerase sigma factor [Candidatus Omnitrophota bacterium]|jgi:RNA polymerase sigma-70 factor (ECF subfamily)